MGGMIATEGLVDREGTGGEAMSPFVLALPSGDRGAPNGEFKRLGGAFGFGGGGSMAAISDVRFDAGLPRGESVFTITLGLSCRAVTGATGAGTAATGRSSFSEHFNRGGGAGAGGANLGDSLAG